MHIGRHFGDADGHHLGADRIRGVGEEFGAGRGIEEGVDQRADQVADIHEHPVAQHLAETGATREGGKRQQRAVASEKLQVQQRDQDEAEGEQHRPDEPVAAQHPGGGKHSDAHTHEGAGKRAADRACRRHQASLTGRHSRASRSSIAGEEDNPRSFPMRVRY